MKAAITTLLGLILVGLGAQAEVDISSSTMWRRARLIPQGQSWLSMTTSYESQSKRFDEGGQLEGLGERNSRSLSWGQVLKSTKAQDLSVARQFMRDQNLGSSDSAANTRYTIKSESTALELNWAYGLTSKWMIGLQAPIVQRTLHIHQDLALAPGLEGTALGQKISKMALQQYSSAGYDMIPEEKKDLDWGDISLLSQELLWQTYHWSWGLQQTIRFPTSQAQSVSNYIQSDVDEGQFDAGLTSLLDYQMRGWTLGLRVGYMAQLPDSKRLHDGNDLRGDSNVIVHRDLGDYVLVGADSQIQLTRHLDVNVEHMILSKGRDHYSGESSEGTNFDDIGRDTDEQFQQSRLSMQLQIGDVSSRDGISNRWMIGAGYTYRWTGKNVSDSSRAAVELINYF